MRLLFLVAFAGLLTACGEPVPDIQSTQPGTVVPDAPRNFPGRSYERNFVFASLTGDSVFLVPWLLQTTTRPGTVLREASGWLARGGTWDAFAAERWETPPTRTPARVLPHGSFRIVVREGDVVDGIIFNDGPRNLELGLGEALAEWAGPRGEVFQLLAGSLYLSEQRVGGIVLDMARGSAGGDEPAGDWAFLTSGDSLQVILQGEAEHREDSAPAYRAWARLDFRSLQWPSVRVDWGEARAFQPARRDVPVSWTLSTLDSGLSGVLDVRSADIRPGDGVGPVLPLRALFEVSGAVVIEGRTFPVRGLFVHERS